jgi:glucose-6-phosphate dehydrogenase assembly protein OpcA
LIQAASIRAVEAELRSLSEAAALPGEPTTLRTRVLTHIAWVPPEWEQAARRVLDGLGDRHPSRTILLLPDPGADRDELDADVDLRCFVQGGPNRSVCSEVVTIWLRGQTAAAPASVVQPLLVSDLPVFLRWRGALPFGEPQLEQLLGVVDRLVVDSSEWPDPEADDGRLGSLLDRVIVSDMAWARIEPWRRAIASLWPGVADTQRLAVLGPRADGLLLARWLCARLGRTVELESQESDALEDVWVDGSRVEVDRPPPATPSALLSDQLEIFVRDRIYEEAVRGSPDRSPSRRRAARGS